MEVCDYVFADGSVCNGTQRGQGNLAPLGPRSFFLGWGESNFECDILRVDPIYPIEGVGMNETQEEV